jgi:hypothetical protein
MERGWQICHEQLERPGMMEAAYSYAHAHAHSIPPLPPSFRGGYSPRCGAVVVFAMVAGIRDILISGDRCLRPLAASTYPIIDSQDAALIC